MMVPVSLCLTGPSDEVRVLPTKPITTRVRCSDRLLNAATALVTTAWISGLSLAMTKALLEQEWYALHGWEQKP